MEHAAPSPLIWLDMEMTGLDPDICVPIEVAIIVTDSNLAELGSMEGVVHQPDTALASMDDFVRKMHTHNGLLDKVRAATESLAEVEERMCALVKNHVAPGGGVLAGNSIHTDRRFVDRYFPRLAKLLHYRMVDVSSLKELVRRWYGEDALFAKPESDHTALRDIRTSIAELAHYRAELFVTPRPT